MKAHLAPHNNADSAWKAYRKVTEILFFVYFRQQPSVCDKLKGTEKLLARLTLKNIKFIATSTEERQQGANFI